MPRAWWQQVLSGTDIAVALLLAPEPLSSPGLPSSAHSATPGPAGTEAGFVSASPPWCAQETGATLSCVSLPAVAHRALLTWLVPHTGQQESHPRAAAIVYNLKCMVCLPRTPSGPAFHLQL